MISMHYLTETDSSIWLCVLEVSNFINENLFERLLSDTGINKILDATQIVFKVKVTDIAMYKQ